MMPPENVILVEGSDDLHFVRHFLKAQDFEDAGERAVNERFVIVHRPTGGRILLREMGGYEKLASGLARELRIPGNLKRLAVIVDADSDADARWRSISDRIQAVGYGALEPDPHGAIISPPDLPIFGLWVMPDNQRRGYREDFFACLIAPDDRLWPLAQRVVDEIPQADRRQPPIRDSQAKVHTWLAWQEEPGTRLSLAFTRGYVNPHCAEARQFADWVMRWLCEPTSPAPTQSP
jgi:hypothetical protein